MGKYSEQHKLWYLKNRDRIIASRRKYYAENKDLVLQRQKKWRDAKPQQYADASKNSKLKRKYGITLQKYQELYEQQKGCCFICGLPESSASKEKLCVDHNHKTGKVRRLLCHSCNRAIGLLKDNQQLLYKAFKYLEEFDRE